MENHGLSENYRFEVLKNYFEDKGIVRHQLDTFNDFLSNGIQRVVKESDIVVEDKDKKYSVSFGDIYIPNPSLIEENRSVRYIYPEEARRRDLTYDSPVFVDLIEKIETVGQEPEINYHRRIMFARIPIMLKSDKCNLKDLTKKERIENGECEWDHGGYFIIRGKERVLVGQLRGVYNQPIVLQQKPGERYKYICETRSMSEETGHSVLIQSKIAIDDRTIVFSLPNIKEAIPVGIVFKALGFTTEEEITNIIGLYDEKSAKYIKYIIRDSFHITTKEDALKYIGEFAMHIIKDDKKMDYALQIVENELLPHMGITSTIKEKVYFLGNMINKLIRTNMGVRNEDDRDNYINKRAEMAGVLCCDLFRALFKRFIKSIYMQIEKKKQNPDIVSIISRTLSITLGLKHSFCFPAGTMISMSNGLSYPIEKLSELSNEHEKVLGWNGTGMISTKHGGLVNQGLKETVKLTFEDGRVLSCTPDHKILVLKEDKTTEWVEAMNIPINSRIVMGLDNPTDNIDEDLSNNWELITTYETLHGVDTKIWTVSTQEERNKTLAFMRILGYIICDGHLPTIQRNQGTIYLGTMFDVERFIDDYKLVTGLTESPIVNNVVTDNWGTTYSIKISNELSRMLRNIDGVLTGKKVTQERSIPYFLLEDNCPKSVIREFLGGLFGGDGYSPRLDIRKGQRTCIEGTAFSWTTQKENLDVLKEVFENIQYLLGKVGVKDTYINGPYPQEENDRYIYRIRVSPTIDFHKYVGFRYCIHKNYKLNIVSSYWRMEEEIKRQHSFIINTVNKLKENDKRMTVKKALDIARKELTEKEYILNNYYSLSSVRDIMKRRENGRSIELKYLQEKYGVPDAKDFINDMGALYMFEGEYANERETLELPCFSMRLMDIRNDKTQVVYDITNVKICNSFFAAGFASKNSTGNWGIQKNNYIRTGVSQVLSRMTHGAVASHLRRVCIPIGREGKNAKIRQIHSSQIMYICNCECFDPSTPILTWNGDVKLAKDIVVGDILIDDKGNPTRVKSTISGISPMYEVQQEKKNFMNYTVTSNHILTLKIKNHKRIRTHKNQFQVHWFDKQILKHKTKIISTVEEASTFCNNIIDDDILDITIENYLKLPENVRTQLYGFKSNGINWIKKDVILDPYILGMWLGDGDSKGFMFTTEDKELLDYWEKWAQDNGAKVNLIPRKITEKNKDVNYTYKEHQISDINKYRPDISYTIGSLKDKLKAYNLIQNKHIPKEYLINDRETRLKVLAGLIDTDGSVRSNGHDIRICQGPANIQIILDALFLAQSLGFSCHLNDGVSQWTHKFEDGTTEKRYSTYKELYITGEFLYEIPTLLERKKLNLFTLKNSLARCSSYLQSPIKIIEKELSPFVGWQLEGNGRFLLSDFTTVHNTPKYLGE